ncbi:MAG: 16S rRNA (cytosine(1402)-N(4))-methyltransferase RsmH [Acidimicrobiales bacterium]
MGATFEHRPVLVNEIVELFASIPAGVIVDATLGGAGHAVAILQAHQHLKILGIDRDPAARAAAAERLAPFGDRASIRAGTFAQLGEFVETASGPVVGVLFDLGVSSPQIDAADRGFSYMREGPLDMRMDTSSLLSAADVVNTYGVDELTRILREYGDERQAYKVAKAIVASRPLRTTHELADVVRASVTRGRGRGGDPSKRTFQAIRIEVNAELDLLAEALDRAVEALVPGGRIAVISYHSGEDRIVKQRLREGVTGGCECPVRLPCVCGATPELALLWSGVRRPRQAEVQSNPRAASALLRAATRLNSEPS